MHVPMVHGTKGCTGVTKVRSEWFFTLFHWCRGLFLFGHGSGNFLFLTFCHGSGDGDFSQVRRNFLVFSMFQGRWYFLPFPMVLRTRNFLFYFLVHCSQDLFPGTFIFWFLPLFRGRFYPWLQGRGRRSLGVVTELDRSDSVLVPFLGMVVLGDYDPLLLGGRGN